MKVIKADKESIELTKEVFCIFNKENLDITMISGVGNENTTLEIEEDKEGNIKITLTSKDFKKDEKQNKSQSKTSSKKTDSSDKKKTATSKKKSKTRSKKS